ncbi:putative plant disease resistance response protein [Medicago truncatula]|uniref:Dirigent protein n=1 Tax=Medicago truncatula TaxID=3880 RepID=A0A396IMV9_MEDTR|nr:dirigent protein 21-like [Medicago truncatula]RHN65933.1 putative plant disease resistance response protein [Medicago truncatula]
MYLRTMTLSHSFIFLFSLTLISTQLTTTNGVFSKQSNIILPSEQQTTEKLTHIHFYYHDIRGNKNPTMLQIIDTPQNVANGFGSTFMMDDAMTEGPELSSKHIGRAQGMFGLCSLHDIAECMLINMVFNEGKYAGSTLSMLGRNPITKQNRETSIVGGTGIFRFARGYAIANSVNSISTPEHYVVEYNITVSHP